MPKSTKPQQTVTIAIETPRQGAPAHLLANAELHFHGGLLDGIRLAGISLWRAQTRQGRRFISVTFPSRERTKAGGELTYFEHIRGEATDRKRLRGAVVEAYRDYARENALEVPEDTNEAA